VTKKATQKSYALWDKTSYINLWQLAMGNTNHKEQQQ